MTSHTSKPKSAYIDDVQYEERLDELPGQRRIEQTIENLESGGFNVGLVTDERVALEGIISRVPAGATIMSGHSTTLEDIGFVDYLIEEDHDWQNLHDGIFATDDEDEAERKRRDPQAADYFLGSINAIAESGELVAADVSGSRLGAYPFAAANILVSGINKIVDDLGTARSRVENVAYRFEDARAQDEYGMESQIAKEFIYHHELEDDRTTVILIDSQLGF